MSGGVFTMKIKNKTYVFLTAVVFLAVWCFAGRNGLFASWGDWSSQHSVIPDYFRQQFYDTGRFFPEFAAGLGGGQNIYHFSYYGLYSPLIWPSYLLPFVKMSDYLMAICILSLLASVLLMHYWLKTHGFSAETALLVSILFLLAAPMIYQSHRQVMFVDYMPFLCMALIGVDRYWKKGKTGLYIAGVFGMVTTSFYFSIAGIFALLMYGITRYQKTEGKGRLFRLFLPVAIAVASAGILLVPTAYALFARSSSTKKDSLSSLFLPDFSVARFAYSGYGIGLTVGILIVLFLGLFCKKKRERLLSAGCLAVISIPFFSWLFNGGLYVREKSLIPFLPVLCYLAAEILEQIRKKEISLRHCAAGYLMAALWCAIAVISQTEEFTGEYAMVFLELLFLPVFAFLYRKTKRLPMLLLPSFLFLTVIGIYLNGFGTEQIEEEFYESVTDASWKEEISDILAQDRGLFRLEQKGNHEEKMANINRIWDARQWTTSMYSSTYQDAYKNFREHIFQTEQSFRNCLMQSGSENPLFQKFMGVKYLVGESAENSSAPWEGSKETESVTADINEYAAPVIYATDKVISQTEYQKLSFPYNQTTLMQYAVVDKENAVEEAEPSSDVWESDVLFPESSAVHKTNDGYRIQAKKAVQTSLMIPKRGADASKEQLLYIQFDVENHKSSRDVIVEISEIRNKLSAESHIYYNGNTTFTYVLKLEKNQKEAAVTFGKGEYSISNIRSFLGNSSILEEDDLYQSVFSPNWSLTKGNQICGEIYADREGYLITSIPYDKGFEIWIDGKKRDSEIVNTAFLGAVLPKGDHSIEIVYHSPGILFGKIFSCLGFAFWGTAAVMERSRKYVSSVLFGYNFLTFFLYNRKKQ